MTALPDRGWSRDDIDAQLARFEAADPEFHKTKMSLGIFYGSDEIQQVLHAAHNRFAHNNNLVVYMRPGTQQMENELLAIALELLGGPAGAIATMSSGGTESVFNALFAAKRWAAEAKPHVTAPEIVAPYSAHPAISKAALYLGLTVRKAPQRPDLRGDVDAVGALVGPNTIALVASAPDWTYGYYDDVEAFGRIAVEHDLWLHVDACVGGFIAPFAKALGEDIPPWDFSVPGVRSISADLHKWAYALKPASIVAYRDFGTFFPAMVHLDDWPMADYATPGFTGSRSAGPVAAAWAVMHHLGRDGYERLTRQVLDGKRIYAERLAAVPGVVVTEPGLVQIGFRHESLTLETLVGGMADRGWGHYVCIEPPMAMLFMDPTSLDVVDEYIADLTDLVERGLAGDCSTSFAGFYGGR